MKIYIFDLDETVIDSAHRTPNNPDGTLNLDAYKARHTPENVAKDKLLPLARTMQTLRDAGNTVWILTARDMKLCDYEFLARHNLVAHKIMSRDRVRHQSHYKASDGKYKSRWIQPLLNLRQFAKAHFIMFDDAGPVLSTMRKLGLTAINAKKVNAKLA
jgi:hypothetical protein